MKYRKLRIVDDSELDTDEIQIGTSQLMTVRESNLSVRNSGKLEQKAIFLSDYIDGQHVAKWIIARDELGILCAIPLSE